LQLCYRIRQDGSLWHWEVLTAKGIVLRHGASSSQARSRAEAIVYAVQIATAVTLN
jgi:hypothetical protein